MKLHAWFTIVLTILLFLVSGLFSIPGYNEVIQHPQFGLFASIPRVITIIDSTTGGSWYTNARLWYQCFFVVDFIWAALFLSYLHRRVSNSSAWLKENPFKGPGLTKLLFIAAVLAYLFDLIENILYLSLLHEGSGSWLSYISKAKVICYAVVLILVILYIYQQYIFDHLCNIKRAIKASILSILAILLLGVLATLMDQGTSVIIHLFDNPYSLGSTFILINLLALASAHYPDYMEKYFKVGCQSNKDPGVEWEMNGVFGKKIIWGMGLITYRVQTAAQTDKDAISDVQRQLGEKETMFFDHFRKITGLMVVLTWIYVLLYLSIKYNLLPLPLMPTMLVVIILFLMLYFEAYRVRAYWRRFVNNNASKIVAVVPRTGQQELSGEGALQVPLNVRFFLNATMWSFILLVLCVALTLVVSFLGTWVQTSMAALVTTFVNAVFIILFLHFRTVFSLAGVNGFLRKIPIFILRDDIRYVRFFAIAGFIALIAFIKITFEPEIVNALVLILMYIYLLYGFVVVILKHHMYYSADLQNVRNAIIPRLPKLFFKKYVPVLGLLLVVWIFFTAKVGNGLHKLPAVNEDQNALVSLDTFKAHLSHHIHSEHGRDNYLIASYGGGLRASAWTMLLLNNLDTINPGWYERTIAMSGVSGGFLGLSMYSAIRNEYDLPAKRTAKIDSIGKHNILSIDLSYLLGFDFVREVIPYKSSFYFRDRAGRSMQEYASLIQPDPEINKGLMETSYRAYWSKAYLASPHQHIPALIGNSTGTHSRYGVALSVGKHHPVDFGVMLPGAVNILDLDHGRSISYLDATSTTERFPIFSPTAQIEDKGDFLDGGYFENSGLLSLTNFYSYLKEDSNLALDDSTTKIIVIINSKDAYIRQLIGSGIPKSDIATGELSAILNTVADIDILPLALEAMFKNRFGDRFVQVYLPYPVTYAEVVEELRGTPEDPFTIQEKINASNQEIEDLLKPYREKNIYPVPPALARVLSEPAYVYLQAMLNHQKVKSTLRKI